MMEAQASGSILDEATLSARAFAATFAMTSSPPSIYVAFCDYYATGEGRTVIVALGGTPQEALRTFEERASPHFVPAIEMIELDRARPSRRAIEKWLPAELLARAEFGPISFFGIFHQNLS